MTYNRISLEQAKKLGSFFTPGITEQEGAKEYWYYIGYEEDEKNIVAAAAVDPDTAGARLLSIGVSPERLRQGIGSELLNVLTEDIRKGFSKENFSRIPPISLRECLRESEWEILGAFLTKNGFILSKTDTLHSVRYSDVLKNEPLKKACSHLHKDRIKALKDVPGNLVRSFSHDAYAKGLYGGIHAHELDQELSIFYLDGEKIQGCVLMSMMEDGNIMNQWVYLDHAVADRTIVLQMLALSALNYEKRVKKDVRIYFLPVREAGERLLEKMMPSAQAEYQVRVYERELDSGENSPVFELVGEDQMVCGSCLYSENKAIECRKYITKPGNVLYGGTCPYYQLKS